MNIINRKPSNKTIQILVIILLFIIVTFAYLPSLLNGQKLGAHDLKTYKGSAKEILDYRGETGQEALWTNSMFGGMPAYLISTQYVGNVIRPVIKFFTNIPIPANFLIINFCLFFLLGLTFGANIWISFAGALAYGLTSCIFILLDAGHITKVQTITYFSLLITGVYMAYNKKIIPGSILTVLGLSAMLTVNHPQMTYYAGIMVLIIVITYFVYAIIEKTLKHFFKASAILFVAALLAVGINFGPLLTINEYGKYSTRGKSDLIANTDEQTTGLDRSYILDYSYDLGEAFTAFIPRFKGGGMAEPLGEKSHFYKELAKTKGKASARQIAKQAPLYWGSQPISFAPFYYGAVLCFLFVFGLFMVKGKEKWWIVATVLISFLLSLGKYLPALSNFMIDYFPGYNKFRDVKNIIVIQQFAMALMGVLAIKEVYNRSVDNKTFFKRLKWAFGLTGGFALIFILIPGLAGDFIGKTDAQYAQMGWGQNYLDALQLDRKAVLRSDAFRTFIFVALAAAGLWAFWTKKIKAQYALALWVVLILADLWPVNKRYLNNDDFVRNNVAEIPYKPTNADQIILKDKSPDYRVLNAATNPFSDASTSYFHKSIGGYHGAKMKRYQEIIEHHIAPEMQQMGDRLSKVKSQKGLDQVFVGLNTLNMLNTKYIIYNPDAAPILNKQAMGNAWIAQDYMLAENANEEIGSIENVDIATTAIIHREFENILSGKEFKIDSSATIILKSYQPNRIEYKYSSQSDQLVVFSEIYYPKGWLAYIDGQEKPILRANYILRSMVVPAGNHEIVFEFKPKSYEIGNKISLASSIMLILAIAGVIFFEMKNRKKKADAETNS